MKFVHCADVHLDSPLKGLEAYESAPVELLRGAARRAMENLVELCCEEKVDFLLIAGDLYDGDWKDFNTGLFFVHQMAKLNQAGIQVYLIRGNHDAESSIAKRVRLPENVHEFPSAKPKTFKIDGLKTAIHGQSFASAAVTADLAAGYPAPVPGWFNIGVLHTALEGRAGHATYAPCDLTSLRNKGYDYWALGHVHQREIVHAGEPHIVFPGNVQGRHVKETGAKGVTLVTVDDGSITTVEHVPCDVLRWALLEVDAEGAETESELLERVRRDLRDAYAAAEGRALAVRIILRGRTAAYTAVAGAPQSFQADVRAVAADVGVGNIWAEKILLDLQRPVDLEAMRGRDDALGELLRTLQDDDPQSHAALRTALEPLMARLPAEAREAEDGIRLDGAEDWRGLLRDVEAILLSRLGRNA